LRKLTSFSSLLFLWIPCVLYVIPIIKALQEYMQGKPFLKL
jgi:hypothetical protein